MSLRMIALLCLAGFSAAHAADVVAWKTPLESLVPEGMATPGLTRCDAPEESPFFSPGDELWGVKAAIPAKADWLVWNATTGRLVAKADMHALWQLHRKLQPTNLKYRLVLEVAEVPADRSPPVHSIDKPARLQAVGQETSIPHTNQARDQGEGWDIELENSGAVDPRALSIRLWLDLTARLQDHPALHVETSIALHPGQQIWLARDYDGERGLDVMLCAEVLLPDESPAEEAVKLDRGGPMSVHSLLQTKFHKLPNGVWLGDIPLHSSLLVLLRFPELSEEHDGFADTLEPHLDLPAIATPLESRKLVGDSLLDVREWLDVIWPDLKDTYSFAGYDPIREALVVEASDRTVVENWDDVFATTGGYEGELPIITLEGKDEVRLACLSGASCRLARGDRAGGIDREVLLEPGWDRTIRIEAANSFGGDWFHEGKLGPDRSAVLPPDNKRAQQVRIAWTSFDFMRPALERDERRQR